MKNLIFICIASAVFFLSIIVLNCAPTINGLIGKGKYQQNGDLVNGLYGWADYPCKSYTDLYNDYKDKTVEEGLWTSKNDKKYHLDLMKEAKNNCLKKKAMIGLEYSAFNINVIFGFICSILGVLLYSGNNIGKIVGLIGLGTGIIGFILTYVYIIYSGIIFDSDVAGKEYGINISDPYSNSYITTKSDGAYLKWKDGKYVCIFYDKDNKDKLYRKYSDYGNKYLNYHHFDSEKKDDNYYKYQNTDSSNSPRSSGCSNSFSNLNGRKMWETCKDYDEGNILTKKYKITDENGSEKGECDKVYAIDDSSFTEEKRNLYNSWVITIVLGCFIFVLDIGLAIFGFLIFKDSSPAPKIIPAISSYSMRSGAVALN